MKIHAISQDAFNAFNDPRLLVKSPGDVPFVLGELVGKIAKIMKADACSLYLYDPLTRTLTLKAAHGLNAEMIDRLQVNPGEGLCGMTLQLMQPISVADVGQNSDFKFIPGLGEDKLKSLLAVPLVYNNHPLGVMAVQNALSRVYKKKDIHLLLSLAIPAVNVVERAKFFGTLGAVAQAPAGTSQITVEYLKDHHIKGIPAASGIAIGKVRVVHHRRAARRTLPNKRGADDEIRRLKSAFAGVADEIRRTKEKAEKKFGPDEAGIFDAYLLFLESRSFQAQIVKGIENGAPAVTALQDVVNKYMDRMAQGGDEYIKERAYDIHDIARKISDRLLYGESKDDASFEVAEDTIFLNESWSVSDFVPLDAPHVRGIVSPQGGASSHVALLADSLGIPAVFGLGDSALQIRDGDTLVIDGSSGDVVVNPSDETLALYRQQIQSLSRLNKEYLKGRNRKIRLPDGDATRALPVGANIEMGAHAQNALRAGADEVGLFRTEFPFLVRSSLPTEDEQLQTAKHVLKTMKKPVTFRTLDIGGDKYISYLDLPKETNPALGWRSIRFSLDRKDLFRIQLRALIKASVFGKMKLLFPMVTTMEQIRDIEDTLKTVKHEVAEEGGRFAAKIPVGYMIEVPAAVEIAASIASRADFLSIGTNDLVQYCLAVDRTNPKVSHLYDPFHPAVLRMVRRVALAGRAQGKPVTVCGDMAANPLLAPVLCCFGVSGLSMNPSAIPRLKTLLRRVDFGTFSAIANALPEFDGGSAVHAALRDYFSRAGLIEFLPAGAFEPRA